MIPPLLTFNLSNLALHRSSQLLWPVVRNNLNSLSPLIVKKSKHWIIELSMNDSLVKQQQRKENNTNECFCRRPRAKQ